MCFRGFRGVGFRGQGFEEDRCFLRGLGCAKALLVSFRVLVEGLVMVGLWGFRLGQTGPCENFLVLVYESMRPGK